MTSPTRRIARWTAFALLVTSFVLAQLAQAEGPIPRHFRVNAGGPPLASSPAWNADTRSDPSTHLQGGSNAVASTTRPIAMDDPSVPDGTPQAVFQTRRWDPLSGDPMTWAFPVDPGRWQVNLYFAETNPNAWSVGERVFDVSIEGRPALTGFDIFALVGKDRGLVTELTTETDNVLDIVLDGDRRRPIVSGIELIALDVEPKTDGGSTPEPEPSPEPESEPEPEPEPEPVPVVNGSCEGVQVPSGADIQAAIDRNPTGTTFCLDGTYTLRAPLYPRSGQAFVGPATIAGGGADTAFQIKTGVAGKTGAVGVTIDGLEIHGFSLRGIDCWQGTVVRNSSIHHNGRNGLGCGLEGLGGVVIEDNEVFRNGSPGETGNGAGGMKFARAEGVTVRGNRVYENIGNGVWCDVDCGRFDVIDNRIWGNTRKGVFYEISHGPALIQGNVVLDNNCSPAYWGDGNPECDLPSGGFGPQSSGSPGGGIATNSSRNVTIRGNTLGGNMIAGINFRDDGRTYDAPFAIVVEGNVLAGDRLLRCGEMGVACSGNG